MNLKFEGPDLGCGSELIPNTEKFVTRPSNGDNQFLQSFSQYQVDVRKKQAKFYLREKSVKQQRDRDGNWGYQNHAGSMKFQKAVNNFIPTASKYKPPSEKEEEVESTRVEQADCNEMYGTARTIETGAMKRLGQLKIKEEEKPQADKNGFKPGGGYQYGFAFHQQFEKNLRNNEREMAGNLVISTQDTHSIDMDAYRSNYGTMETKMDRQLDIERNPAQDPNAPERNQPQLQRFNVVQQEASMEQQQYQRRI